MLTSRQDKDGTSLIEVRANQRDHLCLKGADVQITEKVVVVAAAGNYWSGKDIITLLLDRQGADVQITEVVVIAAVGNSGSGENIIRLLLDRPGADVQITGEVVEAAAGNDESGAVIC